MKQFLTVLLMTCILPGALAWATPSQAALTQVKATHRRNRHRPHKAGKHPHPLRQHRRGV
jgi:hypothetical protein